MKIHLILLSLLFFISNSIEGQNKCELLSAFLNDTTLIATNPLGLISKDSIYIIDKTSFFSDCLDKFTIKYDDKYFMLDSAEILASGFRVEDMSTPLKVVVITNDIPNRRNYKKITRISIHVVKKNNKYLVNFYELNSNVAGKFEYRKIGKRFKRSRYMLWQY